jgi:hypothetical protein
VTTRTCSLGPIHLVLHRDVWQAMPKQKERFARWPASPADLAADLCTFEQGVPALAQEGRDQYKGQKQILLCTPVYSLLVVPPKQGDAYYFVPWMKPLDLHQHERLARGALLLKAKQWGVHAEDDAVPAGSHNDLAKVWQTWQAFQTELRAAAPPAAPLTEGYESYLNTLDKLIEVSRDLVMDKAALSPAIGYRMVESTGEVQPTARDMYVFRLPSGSPRPKEGDLLRLRDAPDLRGRVTSPEADRFTLKFEEPVDRRRIPEQGVFEQTMSDRPFRIQQAAVEALRSGGALNRRLLPALVDNSYQAYYPASIRPGDTLNAAQTEAFQRSLTVPDVLLVLGPPGTGKTQTIAEIVREYGLGHRRVLITAKTHKAVDNVLKRALDELPEEAIVVRIGHEDRIAEDCQELLLDAQAQRLQTKILNKTEAHSKALGGIATHKEEIERIVERFAERIADLEAAEARLRDAQREFEAAEEHIEAHYVKERKRLIAALEEHSGRRRRLDAEMADLTRRQAAAGAKRSQPLAGLFWGLWGVYLARRMERYRAQSRHARAAYEADNYSYNETCKALRQARQAPEYVRLQRQVHEADAACQAVAQATRKAAQRLEAGIAGLVPSRPTLEPFNPAVLRRYLAWFRNSLPLLERRHAILNDWRTRLGSRTEELYPVVIRFADAVGATCIGVATDRNFEDVDFDLVIADEAGQIGLPDLLVPLVRAERALLVGDHHQLPPFVEDEVRAWLETVKPEALLDLDWVDEETTEAEAVTGLLTRSAFELLFPGADTAHAVVRLSQQYRMPQAIADFAAQRFYENQLETVGEDRVYGAPHADPLFKKPLALIDTSGLSLRQRQESSPAQSKSDPESWGMTGYINQLEATLISEMVSVYDREHLDWVVIVPYRAQAQLIRRKLAQKLPAAPSLSLDEKVATVDSFQGGECSRVIYGFTRSNDQGKVGFLRELRRLNVAMTRARQQLVLVGDLDTLTRAKDSPFRDLAQALKAHVQRTGEVLSYAEYQARLGTRRE